MGAYCIGTNIFCICRRHYSRAAVTLLDSGSGESMSLAKEEKQRFLANTPIINWQNLNILRCSRELFQGCETEQDYIENAYIFVRDEIDHSWDVKARVVTCTASAVLSYKTGYCYAKSHLLAALLRARGIACGFCYQRLTVDEGGPPYCLHGLNAVYLESVGWYRMDARGNKEGVNAQFNPPQEQLAFSVMGLQERDFPEVWSEPLPLVVEALQQYQSVAELNRNLPDIQVLSPQNAV